MINQGILSWKGGKLFQAITHVTVCMEAVELLNKKRNSEEWWKRCSQSQVDCSGDQAQSLVLSSRHNELHSMSNNMCSCSIKEFLDMIESLGECETAVLVFLESRTEETRCYIPQSLVVERRISRMAYIDQFK
ncbi:hypothetical protein H5410_000283 [Solanum commersonii]|uniref:Uncharacterized protein n=1 Tax=Solanum commersonii TaxID=4109 RepID=A0A9J6AVL0_SOLCO|nr:hypothetical protein H5410_000283 [Solanum commersonii]